MRQRPRHPDSPLVRLLRDPGGALAHALHVCVQVLEQALPFIAATSGLLLALALALADLRRRRGRQLAAGARLVRIAVPPELDPQAAELLWKTLHDLLRPRLARLLHGQPHLGWEISADRSGSAFRLWLPGSIPPGLVERALCAAWAAYEGAIGLRRRRLHAGREKLERRALGHGFLLSAGELAAFAHLPEPADLPGLVRAGARSVAPPPGLPREGKPLGRS